MGDDARDAGEGAAGDAERRPSELMRAADRYVAQNRRARHDYLIEDTIEAGVVLHGTEVKVLRQGQASIAEAYADESAGELFLVNANIPEYAASAHFNHQPRRPRKLLLHRKQVNRLLGAIRREGITVVPLSIYFNERGRAKVELGLARGKRKADKRQAEKQRDWQRNRARILRDRNE
jgi:SsrA-binding protein